jgi:hypothetical protein
VGARTAPPAVLHPRGDGDVFSGAALRSDAAASVFPAPPAAVATSPWCACRAVPSGTTLLRHDDPGPNTPDSLRLGRFGEGTTLAIFASSPTGVITKCVAPFFLALRSRYATRPSASIDSLPRATGARAA